MFTSRSYVRQPPSSSELELLLPPKQANGSLNWAMACYCGYDVVAIEMDSDGLEITFSCQSQVSEGSVSTIK